MAYNGFGSFGGQPMQGGTVGLTRPGGFPGQINLAEPMAQSPMARPPMAMPAAPGGFFAGQRPAAPQVAPGGFFNAPSGAGVPGPGGMYTRPAGGMPPPAAPSGPFFNKSAAPPVLDDMQLAYLSLMGNGGNQGNWGGFGPPPQPLAQSNMPMGVGMGQPMPNPGLQPLWQSNMPAGTAPQAGATAGGQQAGGGANIGSLLQQIPPGALMQVFRALFGGAPVGATSVGGFGLGGPQSVTMNPSANSLGISGGFGLGGIF